MPSTLHSVPLRPDRPEPVQGTDLAALRAELDRLDDQLHDTLMRRGEVVAQVAALNVKAGVPLRPGREASIIRRLLARHAGALPRLGIVRIWRELLNATTAQQRAMLIAVCEAGDGPAYLAAAREHFGALTPVRAYGTPDEALREVSAGVASAAVLPLPTDDGAAWWTTLLRGSDPRLHIVARLPFWAARPDGTPTAQALVVCASVPDPSGQDRSLIGLELPDAAGRAELTATVTAAGFAPGMLIWHGNQALVEVDGFVEDADPRLQALPYPSVVLGAYAVPVGAP